MPFSSSLIHMSKKVEKKSKIILLSDFGMKKQNAEGAALSQGSAGASLRLYSDEKRAFLKMYFNILTSMITLMFY